jgi:hypothetical protein
MSIRIDTHTPSNFTPLPLTSASQHVIRKRKVEMLPTNQGDYKHSGSNRITFNINSSAEFLDAQNTFLRFDFHAKGNAGAAADSFLSLATGGAHALFKQVVLRLQNGTEILRIDDYNKYYAMMSSMTQSAEHVDKFGWMYGDSVGRYKQYDSKKVKPAHSDSYVAATVSFAQLANADGTIDRRYLPLLPENVDTLTGLSAPNAGLDDILDATLAPTSGGFNAARVEACSNANQDLATGGRTLCMTVPLSILQLHQFLPLPFIQGGLQIEFTLENPVFALSTNQNVDPTVANNATMDYTIKNPRFVCQLVQPSEEIMSRYLAKYKDGTLTYPFVKALHYLNTNNGAAGDMSFVVHPSLRSVNLVTTVCQNFLANTNATGTTLATSSAPYDAIGTFIKANINSYQYRAGSDNFPDVAVSMADVYNAEAFVESQRAFGHLGSVLFAPRASPHEWWTLNTDAGQTESTKLVMAYDMSRDDSIFSGIDISVAPLTLSFGSTAAYALGTATRYLHTFVIGNAILKISQSGVSILS